MLNKKRAAAAAVLGAALLGSSIASIQPAQAFDAAANQFAIVGSDTLEDVVGALTNSTMASGVSVQVVNSDSSTNASFDATGSQTIQTKGGGAILQRPNGSGDGILALLASEGYTHVSSAVGGVTANNTAHSVSLQSSTYSVGTTGYAVRSNSWEGNVDIARSSSGGTKDASGTLVGYPFGRDAISYVYSSGAAAAAASIPAADMVKIWTCDAQTLATYHIYKVFIPQTASGTGKDFLALLGSQGNGGTAVTLPTLNGVSGNTTSCLYQSQEHDAFPVINNTASTPLIYGQDPSGWGSIAPMSASRWIAMKNGASVAKISTDGVKLGNAASKDSTGASTSVTTAADSNDTVPNLAYYKSAWGRDTYLIVAKRRADLFDNVTTPINTNKFDGAEGNLGKLFDYDDIKSYVYFGGTLLNDMTSVPALNGIKANVQGVKQVFGFLPASTKTRITIVTKS